MMLSAPNSGNAGLVHFGRSSQTWYADKLGVPKILK